MHAQERLSKDPPHTSGNELTPLFEKIKFLKNGRITRDYEIDNWEDEVGLYDGTLTSMGTLASLDFDFAHIVSPGIQIPSDSNSRSLVKNEEVLIIPPGLIDTDSGKIAVIPLTWYRNIFEQAHDQERPIAFLAVIVPENIVAVGSQEIDAKPVRIPTERLGILGRIRQSIRHFFQR